MILVDDRQGSKHLLKPLQKAGVAAQMERLDYGDVAFTGHGPGAEVVPIGVEIKTPREMANDLVDPRFSGHQLPGLLEAYPYAFLLIVGRYRPNRYNGRLEVEGSPAHAGGSPWHQVKIGTMVVSYSRLQKHLLTLMVKTPLVVGQAESEAQSVQWLLNTYRWWEDGYDHHQSHNRTYQRRHRLTGQRMTLSMAEKVALKLPYVGEARAQAIAQAFPTVAAMTAASVDDWKAVEGIGPKGAERIYHALHTPPKP